MNNLVLASEEKFLCSLYYARQYEEEIRTLPNDKIMHCTMSCQVALKCPITDVMELGILKEFVDALGLGTCDADDLKANAVGVLFSLKSKNRKDCRDKCLARYPVDARE